MTLEEFYHSKGFDFIEIFSHFDQLLLSSHPSIQRTSKYGAVFYMGC